VGGIARKSEKRDDSCTFFTPRYLGLLSRPFLEEPPVFFVAVLI
jgi:hypothetical protein